ncbi:MAG: thermonuclease family protein [Pseudomonadota bacterium]|nr:thermonuclease family protein [Pseudomonadota bacterium]
MINLRPLFFLACFFVTEIFLHPSHAQVRIIDADTIELDGKKIRLHGVDAPEASQKCLNSKGKVWFCGQHATQALEVLISSHPNKRLSCVESSKDRYQRVIAECFFDELNLNSWLVRNGWAVAYTYYSKDYINEENKAKAERLGIWDGPFTLPWRWRKGERLSIEDNFNDTSCKIKGNISSSGEKIYHLPTGEYYAQTKINLTKDERWFCSEKEAKENGWRKAKK